MLIFLGVFQLGLAYTLFNLGIRHTPAVEVSLLILLEPVRGESRHRRAALTVEPHRTNVQVAIVAAPLLTDVSPP
jgi:hypothetical protein